MSATRSPHSSRAAAPPRTLLPPMLTRPLATAAALLALATFAVACQPTPPPGETPVPEEGPAVTITGACAGEQTIEPVAEAGPKDWADVQSPERTPCFRLTATDAGDDGMVAPETAFVLESAEALSAKEVAALIAITPPVDVDVAKDKPATADGRPSDAAQRDHVASATRWLDALARTAHAQSLDNRYRITPKSPLAPGVVYRIDLKRASSAASKSAATSADPGDAAPTLRSWAFQTRAPLALVHTLPTDKSTWVPTDTGIEFAFNRDGVTAEAVEAAFSIEPAVAGRFEQHRRTVVFVPTRLLTGTLYTVRLAAGVAGPGETQTAAPTVVQFQTRRAEGDDRVDPSVMPALDFRRPLWESPTDEAPVVGLFRRVDETVALEQADVQVYRYASADDFTAAIGRFQGLPRWADVAASPTLDTVGATPVLTFTAPLAQQGDFGELAVQFPEPLEPGSYLLGVTVDGYPVPAGGWLQVTDVAAYAAVSAGKLAVWVNDLATGEPLEGAAVTDGDGEAAGETGDDGVAFVDTPASVLTTADAGMDWARAATTGTLSVTAPDGRSAVVPLGDAFFSFGGGFRDGFFGGRSPGGLYWRYLYTDRQLYRLNDTVHFWGIARARDGADDVETVTVEIAGGDWSGFDYRPIAIARTTVVPDAAGVYSGELTFSGASPSWYTLKARVDGELISQVPMSIEDIVVPAYHLDVQTSRRALMAGEPFSATVTAAFFDGTPASGVDIIAGYEGVERTLSTGADGTVSWTLAAPQRTDAAWQGYGSTFLSVRAAAGEEGDIGANAHLAVFTGANALKAEGALAADAADPVSRTATVSGTVHALDLSRLNGHVLTAPDDFYGDIVPGVGVTVRVTETEQVRIETGERYDFIAKEVVKTYRYDSVQRAVGPFETTADDAGRFNLTFPAQRDRSYEAIVAVADDDGRITERRIWIGVTYLSDPGEPLTLVSDADASQTKVYRVGDEVSLRVEAGGAPVEGGRFLFLRARNGLQDYTLTDEPRFAFDFEDTHVPNVHTLTARFDGRTYRETAWGHDARYDASERRLSVAVGAAEPSYGPGDDATVGVTVTNVAGDPVADASVLVSAVDAAIIQMQGSIERPDPLTTLYESAPAGVLRTYTSHVVPKGTAGAEGGGGGGDRQLFEDTALFARLTTDARGRAEATFTLPDNLTTWVVTGLAATADREAGSGFGVVTVSKPLFVDATLNRTYVMADAPEIRLRAFGTGLDEGGPVSFTIASDTLLDAPIDVAGDAFTPALVPLGDLSLGTHKLRLTARAGDLEDTLIREVTVLPSRLSRVVAETKTLAKGDVADLGAAGDGAVQVVIADANRGGLYGEVAALADSQSDRLDDIVARAVAQDLLADGFGEPPAVPVDLRSTTYQTATGGLSLFPYSAPDIALSADVALAAPDTFGRQGLVQAFRAAIEVADIPREDAIVTLRGLAALGEPVLADVKTLLDAGPELDAPLSPVEHLDLGLAAALLGDQDAAENAYRAVLADHGQLRGQTARIDNGVDADDVLAATARAAVLGALLGDDLAPALHAYAAANPAKDVALAVWHAAYLRAALPRLATTEAEIRYALPDGEQTVTLTRGETIVLHLTKAMRTALDLRVLDGAASVTVVRREAYVADAGDADPDLGLDRTFGHRGTLPPPVGPDGEASDGAAGDEGDAAAEVEGDDVAASSAVTSTDGVSATMAAGIVSAFDEGDLLVITLAPRLGPKAAAGCYQVSDLLPSGLRPVTSRLIPGGYVPESDIVYPYAIEGQRVSFCAWPDEDGEVDPIRYLARAFAPGRYAAEPAIIQAQSAPGRQALSSPATIEVRPRGEAVP